MTTLVAPLAAPLAWALARMAPRAGWLLAGAAMALVVFLLNAGLLAAAGASAGGLLLAWSLRSLAVGRVVGRYAERLVSHHALFLSLADLRVWLFRRIASRALLGPGFGRASDWLTRLVHDVEALDGLYLRALVPLALAVAAGLVAAAALWTATAAGALAALVLTAGAVVVAVGFAARAAGAGRALAGQAGRLRAGTADALSGLRTLAACGGLEAAARTFAAEDRALLAAQRRVAALSGRASAAGMVLAQGALLAALGFAAFAWQGGGATPMVAAALLVLVAALEPIGALPRAGEALAIAAGAALRLQEASELPAPVPDPATPGPTPRDGSLEAEGLSFDWTLPDGARHGVLRGVDLSVGAGQVVAVLGDSGIGKSSLLAALLRLAPLAGGQVRIGGVPLSALSGAEARGTVAALPQHAALFAASIRDNLLLGRPDADEALLWRALALAQLAEFVRALPQGLDAWVGEGAAALSGGQARRLALARTYLQPGTIMLLDEPCAGLDSATEQAVLAGIDTARALCGPPRTTILLLHRLTGAERLDAVFRLRDGRLERAAIPAGW